MILIVEAINDSFWLPLITTFIGSVFGGLVTLLVNYMNEKKRIKMELRLEIWKDLSKDLKKISNSLIEIDIVNEDDSKDSSYKLKLIKKNCNEDIMNSIIAINGTLSSYSLIMKKNSYTDSFEEKFKNFDVKTNNKYDKEFAAKSIDNLYEEFSNLNGVLGAELLLGLYNTSEIKRKLKALESGKD